MSTGTRQATYERVRDFLRANGPTPGAAKVLAEATGVGKRSVVYALARLRSEGFIEERWVGPLEKVIIWTGDGSETADDEQTANERVPLGAR